ncbi:class I SAM-dependent methyltransferase [Citrobacter werkmanii]|uniref:class I SAM-dependent methyltransferase n=1 Tax=Citrobacter werkmanii TaxID=67827 RepID=UPI000EF2676E|nr:class I SAM-dependent methyltransferase [Citrobacter werkmanii]AYL68908.1 class I SAM-dependent methyltransferase [Citrobacter werkmanii]
MQQFNKNAGAYDAVRGKITYPEALYFSLAARVPAHDAALDIGCGNGVSTGRLKAWFRHVEGCDHGDALIERARLNYPDLLFSLSPAESYSPRRRFDLVTSATSFYWMDRVQVLANLRDWLNPGGVFCAYKYDFPVVYGPLRDFIETELADSWLDYRDPRLIQYDNTLELMDACDHLVDCQREVFSNILFLTPKEIAQFFLSTSYVTRYVKAEGGEDYAARFMAAVCDREPAEKVAVNFDIHAFTATLR